MTNKNMDNEFNFVDMVFQQYKAEYGEDAKMENGEEFATVFNNAVVLISLENKKLEIKVLVGKPFFVDHNLEL